MENPKQTTVSKIELAFLRKKYPNIPFDDSKSHEDKDEVAIFMEKVKIAGEAELIRILREKNPNVPFDELEPHEKFLDRIREYEKNSVVEPEEESILRKIFVLFMMTFFRSFYLSLKYERYHLGSMYKLISGILMLVIVYLFASNDGIKYLEHEKYNDFFQLIIVGTVLIWFVKGIFRVGTFNSGFSHTGSGFFLIESILGVFSSSESSAPSQSNIDRAISYRNAKLGQMSGWEAAELLAKTSVLDTMKNGTLGDDANLKRAASYLDVRLGGMTGFDGVDFIAGKNKK